MKKGKIIPILIFTLVVFVIFTILILGFNLLSASIFNFAFMSVYQYPTQLTEPGSLPWWSGECRDDSSECQQLDGVVPFTNTIIVDNDWKIVNSISTPYVAGEARWECKQVVYVYYQDELLGSVSQPDSGGFMVDMTNKMFYDDYNEEQIAGAKDYMRIRNVKSRYVGPPYYQCDYYLNEIIWIQRECIVDSDCDDQNPFTLYDTCENNLCISSEPVQCVSNNDCDYFEECKDNICITASGWLDNDEDGVINKDDNCPDEYGMGDDGCPTLIEQIKNYINELVSIIIKMFSR